MSNQIVMINTLNKILDIMDVSILEQGCELVIVDDFVYELTVNDLTELNKYMNKSGYDLRLRNWALYIYKF